MPPYIFKTLAIIKHSFFWKILLQTAAVTALVYLLFAGAFFAGLMQWDALSSFWLGGLIAGTFGGIVAYFLIPLTFPIISLLFLDKTANKTDEVFYKSFTEIERPSFWQALPATLKFVLVSLLLNLIALPFYFIPVFNFMLYYLLNGYLLGREYAELVGVRYHKIDEMITKRKQQRMKFFIAGVFIAIFYTIPFISLVSPILATVLMVHVWRDKEKENISFSQGNIQ